MNLKTIFFIMTKHLFFVSEVLDKLKKLYLKNRTKKNLYYF